MKGVQENVVKEREKIASLFREIRLKINAREQAMQQRVSQYLESEQQEIK